MRAINQDGLNNFNRLLLMHTLAASIIISIFVIQYSKSQIIIALHAGLVASLYFTAFIISRIWKNQFRKVAILGFTTLSGLLVLNYSASFLSNRLWNNNMSLESIRLSISEIPVILEGVPYGESILIVLVLFIFFTLYLFYSRYCHYLEEYDKSLTNKSLLPYAAITAGMSALFFLSFNPTNPGIWEGEPISNLAVRADPITNVNNSGGEITFANNTEIINTALPNIILIHADAMRADHMSSYGYERNTTPFIHSLIKKGGIQIETGLSICSESICGMHSALTSKHIDSVSEETPTLITHLKRAGYRTMVAGSGDFTVENISHFLARDADYFERADTDENFSIYDDRIITSSLSRVPDYEGVPTFFFLRYMSSHRIGRHFPQYQVYTPFKKSLIAVMFPAFDDISVTINGYDNGIIQLDNAVRLSENILAEKGYLDNSIIIIYGDHGEAINEHGYFGHVQNLYQEEIHIPIIFISTKKHVFMEETFATLNDILPTTLDMANLTIPGDIEGVSLLDEHPTRHTYHDNRRGIYAISEKTPSRIIKLMLNSKTGERFLYDLTADPDEKNNIGHVERSKTQQLLNKLKAHFNLG
jgi:glucan phosphoethanolaminetransferase (alkaline phosphatase superfamily)